MTSPSKRYTADEIHKALRPLASLVSKSEKAQQKLKPGTWQHTMLRDNLKALHLATALMNGDTDATAAVTPDDLQAALHAFASMISRAETAQEKFSPGASQHTLQQNRLEALHLAKAFVAAEVAP